MKTLIKLMIILTLMPASAGHAAVGQRSPELMMNLVDDYITEVSSKQPGGVFLLTGRQEYLAKAVAAQIAALEPEDFNLFQFYLMDRFVKNPSQRQHLYAFNGFIRELIAADLANSEQLRKGGGHNAIVGSYTYGTWILLGGIIGWRFVLSRSTRTVDFLRQVREREVAISKSPRIYRIGFKVATNPLAWSLGIGSGIGYVEYLLQSNRTRRLDPMQIMMVVQAQLACHISYSALEVQEEFEALQKTDAFPVAEGTALLKKIGELSAEAGVLAEQFSRLEQLDVRDPLFQRTLSIFPPAKDWAQFRANLTDAETSKDGQCRQMSLVHVRSELQKTANQISNLLPAPEETKDPASQGAPAAVQETP